MGKVPNIAITWYEV